MRVVLANQIVSEREIKAIMDGILDFYDDEKFLAQYKKLCRHAIINTRNCAENL